MVGAAEVVATVGVHGIASVGIGMGMGMDLGLSLIHISEPTRPY